MKSKTLTKLLAGNLTQEALQEARSKIDIAMKHITPAATIWLKYDQSSLLVPAPGEWCLWSFVHRGERNYCTGSLFISKHTDKILLNYDNCQSVEMDDTFYFANVNTMDEG